MTQIPLLVRFGFGLIWGCVYHTTRSLDEKPLVRARPKRNDVYDKDLPTCFDGASLTETYEPDKDEGTTASLPQALACSASGGGSRCEGGASNTDVDPGEEVNASESLPEDPRNAPLESKEPHGRALPSGRPARMTRSKLRQPLRSLQPTRMNLNRGRGLAARAVPAGDKGRGKGKGKGKGKRKGKAPRDVGSDSDDFVMEEEESPRTKRKREKTEKVEREKKMKIQEAARSREESRRCRQTRCVRLLGILAGELGTRAVLGGVRGVCVSVRRLCEVVEGTRRCRKARCVRHLGVFSKRLGARAVPDGVRGLCVSVRRLCGVAEEACCCRKTRCVRHLGVLARGRARVLCPTA